MNPEEIKKLINALTNEAREHKENAVIHENLARLTDIARSYAGEDKIISSLEIAEKLKTRPDIPWIKSSIRGLDSILSGFLTKQVITIAAPTKNGKTQFCVELTSKLKEHAPMWLPFEEPAEELIQKFLDRGEAPPLFYTPEVMTGNTMLWVEKKIIEAIAKHGSKIIFIDHLHFIVPFSSERMDLRIGETMRALKGLAKKWDVAIFLIAHLSKTKLETSPDISDLRDSSFIAQESDTVILLWRETKRGENGQIDITNNVNISVQANRRTGKTGNVQMVFKDGHFIESAWTPQAEMKRQAEIKATSDYEKW